MEKLFIKYRKLGVSDLHIRENDRLCYRKDGDLYFSEEVISRQDIFSFCESLGIAKEEREKDISYEDILGNRYRLNWAKGEKGSMLSVRIISEFLPEFPGELYTVLEDLYLSNSGLVLVTGSTGSGKSTTLRFFLEEYNRKHSKKIICLEDPIEFYYQEKKSLFFQREIGRDSESFQTAMKSALRQDPDVLLIGEIRDLKSLQSALYFAESGHLVFSTLHTGNCVESIHKILSLSPKEKQEEVRQRLSSSLRWMIAQELVKGKENGRIALFELLKNTKAVANIIYSGRELQLPSILESSFSQGMCTKEKSREYWVQKGKLERI